MMRIITILTILTHGKVGKGKAAGNVQMVQVVQVVKVQLAGATRIGGVMRGMRGMTGMTGGRAGGPAGNLRAGGNPQMIGSLDGATAHGNPMIGAPLVGTATVSQLNTDQELMLSFSCTVSTKNLSQNDVNCCNGSCSCLQLHLVVTLFTSFRHVTPRSLPAAEVTIMVATVGTTDSKSYMPYALILPVF